jgi:hypothetical protein
MSVQTWQETLITAQVDGSALSNSTTATSILPAAARYTLPSNYFYIGTKLRIKAGGRISTVVTTPGTLTLAINFGTIASPIIVFNGGAMSLNTTAQTNDTWLLEAVLTCRAIGSGTNANMMGVGQWTSAAVVGAASGVGLPLLIPATAPAVGTGFDSTLTNTVDLFATWSVANASNSLTLHDFSLESMN